MNSRVFMYRFAVSLLIALPGPFIFAGLSKLLVPSVWKQVVSMLEQVQVGGLYAAAVLAMLLVALTSVYFVDGVRKAGKAENDSREEGVVKWFNVSKGFGFITRSNGEDVFVHFRSIQGQGNGHRSLHEGQKVRFGLVDSDKGLQAENVSVVHG